MSENDSGPVDNSKPAEGGASDSADSRPRVYSEQVHNDSVGARVPDRVGQGVFCTGAIVQEGADEFIIDFVQGLARPARVASRVVVSQQVMSQFVAALKENLHKYQTAFGPPKELPRPQTAQRPSVQEIYKDLKMSDDVLSGAYATAVMISHSPAEFVFDFITRFFPTAAVSARVYLSASQVPRLLDSTSASLQRYLARQQQKPRNPPQPSEPTP
jgi:hypothetical protein